MSGEEVEAELEVEAEVEAEAEEPPSPPPTPIPKPRAPRKKKDVVAATPGPPIAFEVNADFWGKLLATRRAMDQAATRERYSNLVKFK